MKTVLYVREGLISWAKEKSVKRYESGSIVIKSGLATRRQLISRTTKWSRGGEGSKSVVTSIVEKQ